MVAWEMGSKLVVITTAVLVLLYFSGCSATVYVVGDNSGWDISTDLDSWAKDKTFAAGDSLCTFPLSYIPLHLFLSLSISLSMWNLNSDNFSNLNIVVDVECSVPVFTIPFSERSNRGKLQGVQHEQRNTIE